MRGLTRVWRSSCWAIFCVAAGWLGCEAGPAAAAVTERPPEAKKLATFGGVTVRGKLVPRVAPIAQMCPEMVPVILAGSTVLFVPPPDANEPEKKRAGAKPKPGAAKRVKLPAADVMLDEVGLLQVDVDHDLPLYIAVSWGDEGGGEWAKERLEKDDLTGRGWALVGKLPMRLGETRSGRWLYWRQAKAGDSFRLRTRKIVAPIVIVPPAGAADPLGDRSGERFNEDMTQDMLKAKAWYFLQQQKFDELESLIDKFRRKPTRLGSGVTRLRVAYEGIGPYYVRSEAQWKQYLAHLEAWCEAKPASPTPRIVWAGALRGYAVGNAWHGRDMQWANVSDQQRQIMLEQSLALCEDARKLDDRDPELYRTLVLLAIPCDWPPERVEPLLQRSATLDPTYLSTFAQAAHYFCQNADEDAGASCARAARAAVELTKSKSGHFVYSLMAIEALSELGRTEIFKPENFSWETTRQGFLDAEQKLPHSDTRDHEFCKLACIAGDRKTAAEQFHKLNNRQVERFDEIWRHKLFYGAWQAWALPDYLEGEQVQVLVAGRQMFDGLTWTADGSRLVTVDREPDLQVWDARTGQPLFEQSGLQSVVASLVTSADSKLAATGENAHDVLVWQLDGKSAVELGKHPRAVTRVKFSRDASRLASGARDGSIALWDVAGGKQIAMWPAAHDQWIRGLDFTLDGKQLISCADDRRTHFWDVASGKRLASLPDSANKLSGALLSPDGKLLALADTRVVTLWKLPERERLGKFEGDARFVNEMAFSADGSKLACATGALNVIAASDAIVWDVASRRRLRTLHGHKGAVTGIGFSPDGKQAATASLDMTVRLWKTSD